MPEATQVACELIVSTIQDTASRQENRPKMRRLALAALASDAETAVIWLICNPPSLRTACDTSNTPFQDIPPSREAYRSTPGSSVSHDESRNSTNPSQARQPKENLSEKNKQPGRRAEPWLADRRIRGGWGTVDGPLAKPITRWQCGGREAGRSRCSICALCI